MADDIKIIIGVEQNGLLKAISNTETLQGKVKKLSSVYAKQNVTYREYNKAIGELAKSTKRSKTELLAYGTALRADEKATVKATQKVKALALARKVAAKEAKLKANAERVARKATEDLARAEEKNVASLKSMRMATDSVYRNQQKRLQMKKLLRAAIASNTMTTEQAIVALKRYNAAQMSSTKVMGMSKNKMNGTNMAVQQLGYQMGDFAVQVQGGTSAFVAFSQQGAQLAGILPSIAGPLGLTTTAAVGLSASLGILIPVGSAVGRMLYEWWGSAKDTTDILKELEKAQDSLTDAIKAANIPLDELIDKYGEYASVIKEVHLAKLEDQFLDAKLAMKEATSALSEFSDEISRIERVDRVGIDLGIKAEGPRGQRYTDEQRGEIRGVQDLFGQIYESTTPEEQLHLLQELREKLTGLGVDVNDFPSLKVSTFSDYMVALADLDVALQDAETSSNGLGAGTSDAYKRSASAADDLSKAIFENNQEMSRNLELAKGETDVINNVMGAEDALGKLRATYARADHLSKKLSQGMSGEELTNAMLQYDALVAQHKVKEEANKRAIAQQEKLDKALAEWAEKEERRRSRNASVVTQLHRVRQSQQREAREEQTRINALEEQVSEYAKNNNWEKTQLQKTTQQILADAIQVYKQEKAIREEIGDAAAEALKLAGIDITTGVDAAAKAAAVLSANLGISFKHATELMALAGTGVSGPSAAQYASQDEVVEGQGKRADGLYGVVSQTSTGGSSKGGSSGKSPQEGLAEYLKGKEQELELETKLVGIFGSERTVKSQLFEIEKKYGALIDTTQDSQLAGTLLQIEAEKERNAVLEEAKQQQEQLANFIGDSMENAMMGIVDGTLSVKDAFKSMAADIIKELYRVLVVQEMVATAKEAMDAKGGFLKMAGSFLGFGGASANGNVFSGGSQVQAYANGGVVNGPTNFPMSGNKVGLMGEAGPEAIMPLKRGSNGKLGVQMEGGGGGGDVININQSFNFQANGDDSVKKLIAQAAPKIADMAKASVIESRRRGGSTKAAFG